MSTPTPDKAMPERLDRITVTTAAGLFELSWDSREALLAEIRDFDSAAGIVKVFEDVGASRPVTLSDAARAARPVVGTGRT